MATHYVTAVRVSAPTAQVQAGDLLVPIAGADNLPGGQPYLVTEDLTVTGNAGLLWILKARTQ